MASHPPSATCGDQPAEVGPRRIVAVPAVNEAERQRAVPAGGDRGGVAHDAHDGLLEAGDRDGATPVQQRVDATGLGIDQVGLVVLPPGLVLLGAPVVVDRNTTAPVSSAAAPRYTVDLPHQAPISTKVGGVAPGISARPARWAARNSASPSSSGMKPRVPRAVASRSRTRSDSRSSLAGAAWRHPPGARAGRPQRVGQAGPLAGSEGHVDVQALGRLGDPPWARRQRVVLEELDRSTCEVGVARRVPAASRGCAAARSGKRSRIVSQVSVIRVQTAWLPTRLANNAAMTLNPFWVRTSVRARSNVRRQRSTSGKLASAPSERISSCGVDADR